MSSPPSSEWSSSESYTQPQADFGEEVERAAELGALKVAQLRERLVSLGESALGRKPELLKRLLLRDAAACLRATVRRPTRKRIRMASRPPPTVLPAPPLGGGTGAHSGGECF